MTKERPILFNGAMVRAILSGAKTQTRRAVKGIALDWLGKAQFTPEYVASPGNDLCPFGQPGDRLWVRETFLPDPNCDHVAWDEHTVSYLTWSGCGSKLEFIPPALRSPDHCLYRADWTGSDLVWRPSIHMPRWACRLVLDITDVRVERLQAISEADAVAEGAMEWAGEQNTPIRDLDPGDERIAFKALWESTGGDWDSNPWVWVIEFKQVAA